jgi:hypothetical protein
VAEPQHRWWPATPFGLGWFGHTQAGRLGEVEPPPVAHGVVRPPLGPNGNLSVWPKGRPNHPLGWFGRPLGQSLKILFLGVWPKGRPNHPLGHWGWFGRPQTGWPGGGQTTPSQTGWPATTYGVVRPPQHIYIFLNVMGAFWK